MGGRNCSLGGRVVGDEHLQKAWFRPRTDVFPLEKGRQLRLCISAGFS